MATLSVVYCAATIYVLLTLMGAAKKRGIETGERLAKEEIRKRADEQHDALVRLLSEQVTTQLTNMVDARNRGIVRSRILERGEFRRICKIPVDTN
jgi:hypothetical protein